MAVNYHGICLITLGLGLNVIKHFTMVIYFHSMVILSFSVIKLYDLGDYGRMVVTAIYV